MIDHFRIVWRCASALLLVSIASLAPGATFPDPSIPQSNYSGSNRSHGLKNAIYFWIRGEQASPLSPTRINTIRQSEIQTRQFFAASSGGAFDIYYDHIVDVPIPLDAAGRRPDNWRTLADNYVASSLGINPNLYYAHVYDVSSTTADADQGWSGIYYGGTDLALQGTSQLVVNHELGHRASADHASSWRGLNDSNYNSYVWSPQQQSYVEYDPNSSAHDPLPFGARRDEYGNPFDVMGNINGGDFRVGEKLRDLRWLDSSQVGDLNTLGDRTYRLYAHDELQSTTDRFGNFGVVETYAPDALYGLTFERTAQRLDTSGSDAGTWDNYTQVIDLEYREGSDQVLFYLDALNGLSGEQSNNAVLLDLDPAGSTSRSNTSRGLRVGRSIEDISFGMSTYYVNDEEDPDFLSYSPVPPADPQTLRPEWYYFHVLGTGSDSIGSYVELLVETTNPLNGIVGDLNQNGRVDEFDLELFVAGWLTDTSMFNSPSRYSYGDINLNGITDLQDASLMRYALSQHGVPGNLMASLLNVPEGSSLQMLVVVLAFGLIWQRRRAK